MTSKWVVAASLALLVAACSPFKGKREESGEVTLSWYCRKLDDGGQYCEKRRLRNGRPVDDVVYEQLTVPTETPVAAPAQPAKSPPRPAGEAVRWNRNTLSAVNAIKDTSDLDVENTGPEPRTPKNTVDMWEKHRKRPAREQQEKAKGEENTVDRARLLGAPGTGVSANASAATPKGPNGAGGEVEKRYTLQLAAFATVAQCQTFMARKDLSRVALEQRNIVSKGKTWCIVTHGDFADYGEAQAAAKSLAAQHGGIKPWARSHSVLKKLEPPG